MIDTSGWKEFKLTEIFDITNTESSDLGSLEAGKVKFVGRTAENNGVQGFVDVPDGKINKGNCISLSRVATYVALWQPESFTSSQHITTLRNTYMNCMSGLFICTVLNEQMKYKYNYGRTIGNKTLESATILLPANNSGEPDWQYMEDFMVGLHCEPITTSVKSSHLHLETEKWGEFRIGDLFDVRKGKRLTSEDQTEGDTPYVGAIDSNNGIANSIGQLPIHKGGTISLSYNGSVGEAFYQPVDYWATDDVNALYLKPEYGTLSEYTGLFIATLLRQEKYRYSYGRKWVLTEMENTIIRLPVTPDGTPDWQWMEDYMKSLPYSDRIAQTA